MRVVTRRRQRDDAPVSYATQIDGRVMPHDLEAEKAVIGALLISDAAASVVGMLQPGDFYRVEHQRIFTVAAEMAMAGGGIDPLTICSALRVRGQLDEAGGAAYISGLTDGVPKSMNARHYAEIVREHATRRRLAEMGVWLVASAHSMTSYELMAEAPTRLFSCARAKDSETVLIESTTSEYVSALMSGETVPPMATGFADLDKLVGGFRRKQLVIVAARPSVGKTSLMLGMADNMAARGDACLVCSLEVSKENLTAKRVIWHARASKSRLEGGEASEGEYQRAHATTEALAGRPLWLNDTVRSPSQVYAVIRQLKAQHDIKCVFIDYIGLMIPEEKSESREREVAILSRTLKQIAKDLNVCIVALSQLSRSPESRKDKRPKISDLRESGALEQDADMVLLPYRPEMHTAKEEHAGIAELIVAKNRDGATGSIRLAFIAHLSQFADLAREEE
jgi:replicative DNA helicase